MLCELTGLQKSTMGNGRICVKVPNHPKANNRGYVLRSRYLMEQSIGRYLKSREEVHHKNEIVSDDDLENLEVLSKSEHAKLHNNFKRTLDYDLIKRLRLTGLGYKKIMKETGYARSSIRSACKTMGI